VKGESRIKQVKQSIHYFAMFLSECKKLKLIDNKTVLESEMKFNVGDGRQLKIARYKKRQEIAKKAEEMLKKIKIDKTQHKDVEEIERDYFSLLVTQYAYDTIEELKNTKEELTLLEYAEKNIDEEKLEKIREDRKIPGKPNIVHIPINNLNQRDEILKQVFMKRNQPTMSLDEFAEEEMKKIQINTEKEKAREKEARDNKGTEEEEEDKQTMKDREFDDWKDWNPKGMGNMNK
jgi:immunoglobulin-binding protein 1